MKKFMWLFIIALIIILIIIAIIMVKQSYDILTPEMAKTIAQDYLSRQTYNDAYESEAYSVTEFGEYFEVKFRRKTPIPEKGDGLIRVDKKTRKAEWVPGE